MHTPITANGGIYCERTNGDIARLAGADSASSANSSATGTGTDTGSGSGSSSSSSSSSSLGSRGAEARRGLKGPRRKPNGTAEDPARHKRKPGRPTRRKGKKPPGVMNAIAALLVRNQIRMSVSLILALAAAHALRPDLRPTISKFYQISYRNPISGLYGKGLDDLYLVFFWITLFTFLRSTVLDYVFLPLARMGGINTPRGIVRFSEQAWLVVYYGAFWGVGMYIMYHSPYWNNMEEYWTDYPVKEVSGLFKWYYLAQFAFWLQQIFVLNIEEWRKDHWQMFAHHIITCALISASYTHHMMRVGHVILCVMDVIDIMLSCAKLLKYLGYSTICDYAFGLFLVGWIVGRHGFYNRITWSVYKDSTRIIEPGCYHVPTGKLVPGQEVNWRIVSDTFTFQTDVVCYSVPVQRTFLVLLVGLQIITLLWLCMIFKVAWRVMTGAGADDTRSEDEAEDEDDDDDGDVEEDETEDEGQDEGAEDEGGELCDAEGMVTAAPKKTKGPNGSSTAAAAKNGNGHYTQTFALSATGK